MGQGKNNRKKRDSQAENGNGQVRQQDDEAKKLEKEIEEKEDNKLEEYGQVILEDNRRQRKIHLITIIGEVEGHENSSGSSKTTKYDHILPKLAEIEDDDSVDGLLVLLNTSGGEMCIRDRHRLYAGKGGSWKMERIYIIEDDENIMNLLKKIGRAHV